MVPGEFDSLVSLDTGGAEVLDTVHTKPGRFSVVITGHTELQVDETGIRRAFRLIRLRQEGNKRLNCWRDAGSCLIKQIKVV